MRHDLKILVAVDSSHFSTEVLNAVSQRKWEPGCKIRVLTVVDPSTNWEIAHQFIQQCELIQESRIKTLEKALPECIIEGEVLEGNAPHMILEAAGNWNADLIVIGSHGDTGIRKASLGSVAAAVVNKAPCSVEVIKVKQKRNQAPSHIAHRPATTAK